MKCATQQALIILPIFSKKSVILMYEIQKFIQIWCNNANQIVIECEEIRNVYIDASFESNAMNISIWELQNEL